MTINEYIKKFEDNFLIAIRDEENADKIAQKLIYVKVITLYELIFEHEFPGKVSALTKSPGFISRADKAIMKNLEKK